MESNQPRLCCLLGVVFPRRQLPSSLSSFELAFQSVATDVFDSINNRPIYSALVISVFRQWRRSSIRKQPYISPFQHLVVLLSLAFLGSTTASFPYYCALESIRAISGQLAFLLLNVVMRHSKEATEPAQISTEGCADPMTA